MVTMPAQNRNVKYLLSLRDYIANSTPNSTHPKKSPWRLGMSDDKGDNDIGVAAENSAAVVGAIGI
jgi:hypothetical protein